LVIKVGVLELQGDFELHHRVLQNMNIPSCSVKNKYDLENLDGLIIPGGESTTMSLLIDSSGLRNALTDFGKNKPVMGTCAGLILMAKMVTDSRVKPLGFIDVEVNRNAYGRQIESRQLEIDYKIGHNSSLVLPTSLIRAPRITYIGNKVNIIGEYNNSPVAVIEKHFLGLTFHPELDRIGIFHKILFDSKSSVYYKNNFF
tara:strand:- start:126 stop:728 length:603 start_codon:yes stop_codon:yes gene_type:complete